MSSNPDLHNSINSINQRVHEWLQTIHISLNDSRIVQEWHWLVLWSESSTIQCHHPCWQVNTECPVIWLANKALFSHLEANLAWSLRLLRQHWNHVSAAAATAGGELLALNNSGDNRLALQHRKPISTVIDPNSLRMQSLTLNPNRGRKKQTL